LSQIWLPIIIYGKEKHTRILIYSWLATGTYHKKSSDFDFIFLQKLANLGHFFPEKAFV